MDFSFAVCCRIFLLTNCNCCRASLLPGSSFNTCSKSSLALSRSSTATRAWKQKTQEKSQGQMNLKKLCLKHQISFSCGAVVWCQSGLVITLFPLSFHWINYSITRYLAFTHVMRRLCWCPKQWPNVTLILHDNRIKFPKCFVAIVLYTNMAAVTSCEKENRSC